MRKLSVEIEGRFVPAVRMTQRSKWGKPAQRYLAWKKAVAWRIKEKSRGQKIQTPCGVDVLIMTKRQNFDADNVLKGVLDALQYSGVLLNDNAKNVRDLSCTVTDREKESLLIWVTTLGESV